MSPRATPRAAFVAVALALAVVLGLCHLSMPPGREGAALEVAARALRAGHRVEIPPGATPGVFALTLLGTYLSPIPGLGARVLSLASVLALGVVAPRAFTRRATPLEVTAASVLAASWFAHAFFDFWCAGRGEVPAHLALLSAVALAARASPAREGGGPRRRLAAAIWPVALFAASVALSPRVALLLPVLVYVVSAHQGRRAGAFTAVAAIVASAVTAAASRGALGFTGFGDAFATEGSAPLTSGILTLLSHFRPTAAVLTCAAILAVVPWFDRREEGHLPSHERAALIAYAVGTWALCAVAWTGGPARIEAMIAPLAVMAGVAAERALATGRPTWLPLGATLLVSLGLVTASSNPANHAHGNLDTELYVGRVKSGARALLAGGSRRAYLGTFSSERVSFFPDESLEVGEWLRANGAPGDALVVRGYEPQIYLHARMSPGAFHFTTERLRAREPAVSAAAWARDGEDLARLPRWIVTLTVPEGPDSARHVGDRYRPRATFPHFLIFERTGQGP